MFLRANKQRTKGQFIATLKNGDKVRTFPTRQSLVPKAKLTQSLPYPTTNTLPCHDASHRKNLKFDLREIFPYYNMKCPFRCGTTATARIPLPNHRRKNYMVRVRLGTTRFDPVTLSDAVQRILDVAARHDAPAPFVVTPNVDHLLRLDRSPELHPLYNDAFLSLPDGMPVIWAARFLGLPLRERVTGADLVPALCREAGKRRMSVFFFGGPPGSADEAARRHRERFPDAPTFALCPPMGFDKNPEIDQQMLEAVNKARPDILLVGVGSPRQELWIYKHRASLRAGVSLGIGAAIEFEAGTLRRAPRWMQKIGMEWFWRILQDPKRLTMRYVKNFAFAELVLRLWWQKNYSAEQN
jgi:N-acetylglucosaminyldiphosphoundecaprenol N-acetyl-beta-D-mannosaminyltransferase